MASRDWIMFQPVSVVGSDQDPERQTVCAPGIPSSAKIDHDRCSHHADKGNLAKVHSAGKQNNQHREDQATPPKSGSSIISTNCAAVITKIGKRPLKNLRTFAPVDRYTAT